MEGTFPKSSVLYSGCTLAVLVNALATFEYGASISSQWNDENYIYNGGDGNYAFVTFRAGHLVATLFDHDSDRTPFHSEGESDAERFFRGLPADYRPLAEWCLGFIHEDPQGNEVPMVTAAFWDGGEYLVATEPWEQVWEHGGHLLKCQLMENPEEALPLWHQDFGLSAELIDLARSLFRRKMARPGAAFVLESDEAALLRAVAEEDPEKYKGEPMKWILKTAAQAELNGNPFEEGCKALASIGIHLP
jgi:hypothetical protein